MTDKELYNLRFPLGEFDWDKTYTPLDTAIHLHVIENLTNHIRQIEALFDQEALKSIYRPDSWNVAQLIHHLCDSHLNAYSRFKFALTENNPTIKPYLENQWVPSPEAAVLNVFQPLDFLDALHRLWLSLMKGLSPEQWERTYFHPHLNRSVSLREAAALYAWHSVHHLAHIRLAIPASLKSAQMQPYPAFR